MPRFVILEHVPGPKSRDGAAAATHWDLMLECGGTLRTFALEKPPTPGAVVEATALPNHRMDYLTYEGPVSGGRGDVARWDAGTFTELPAPVGAMSLVLEGRRTRGPVVAERDAADANRWRFRFHADSPKSHG